MEINTLKKQESQTTNKQQQTNINNIKQHKIEGMIELTVIEVHF